MVGAVVVGIIAHLVVLELKRCCPDPQRPPPSNTDIRILNPSDSFWGHAERGGALNLRAAQPNGVICRANGARGNVQLFRE